jgi:hypothetical protein
MGGEAIAFFSRGVRNLVEPLRYLLHGFSSVQDMRRSTLLL